MMACYVCLLFFIIPRPKIAKTCMFCGQEIAYYSHVFSVYDVTI